MRTTIKDIAKYTGFSITTISLVLNGKAHKIPKATEEAILQAAKELNYRPNQLAVGLVKKQTKTLGLILSDIRNNFFANMAKSIEDECRRNGWNLILCNTNDLHEREMKYLQILSVPLTSIHQPVEEMGTEAVQQMIRIIRQKQKQDTKKNIMFQPYLVVRQSTAAPAGVMHI